MGDEAPGEGEKGRYTKPFDLHVHSHFSGIRMWKYDGFSTPRQIVEEAARLGLSGIAVADHNTTAGYNEARKVAKELALELMVLPAQEARCSAGDVLVLGLSDTIKKAFKLSAAELVDKVHDEGGIAIAAHPYAGFWGASVLWAPLSVPFDAVEVYNSHCALIPPINTAAARLAAKARLPGIAGSDAHLLEQLGHGITLFSPDDLVSVDAILDAIRKDRFAIRGGAIRMRSYINEWLVKFRVNGRYYLHGTKVSDREPADLTGGPLQGGKA